MKLILKIILIILIISIILIYINYTNNVECIEVIVDKNIYGDVNYTRNIIDCNTLN